MCVQSEWKLLFSLFIINQYCMKKHVVKARGRLFFSLFIINQYCRSKMLFLKILWNFCKWMFFKLFLFWFIQTYRISVMIHPNKFQFAFIRTSGILVLVHLNLDFSFDSSEVTSLHIKITAYWMTTDWNYGLLRWFIRVTADLNKCFLVYVLLIIT